MKTDDLARSLLLAGMLLAAGCGGGGGGDGGQDPGSPPVAVDDGPAEPMDKFLAFVKAMVQVMADGAEPGDVSAFDPPTTSDTREPIHTAAQ